MKKAISYVLIMTATLMLQCAAFAGEAVAYWCASGVEAYGVEISMEEYCKTASCTPDEVLSLEIFGKEGSRAVINGNMYPLSVEDEKKGIYLISFAGAEYTVASCDGGRMKACLNDEISVILSPVKDMPAVFREDVLAAAVGARELPHAMLDRIEAVREAEEKEAFRQSVMLQPIEFTADETAAMSNFMLHGRYYFEGDTLFGMTIEAGNPYLDLIRANLFYDGVTPKTGEVNLIDDHVNANYLTPYANTLYYVCHDRDAGRAWLASLNMTTLEVEKLTTPADNAGFLQIRNEKIWFTDATYRFCTCDLNGKNIEIILDKPVYSPYFISDDWLIYQNAGEDLVLRAYRLSDGMDLALTDVPACNPIICGHTLFFMALEGSNGKGRLGKIDLSAPLHGGDLAYEAEFSTQFIGEEFSIFNGVIYGCNETSVAVANWKNLSNTAWNGVTQRIYYMNETYSVTATAVRDDAGENDLVTMILLGDQYGNSSAFKRIH